MKKIVMITILSLAVMAVQGQGNKYIVKTKGAKKTATVDSQDAVAEEEEKATDLISQNFRYVSMCDWKDGMRFMVIPEKKDMIIKTFTESSTDQMVSSSKLRHKIMVYAGHENTGGLHERVNFFCEDDGKAYYFEVPTASFDDYCYGKLGVPTLAYLGDVDTAIELLKDKTLFTKAREYYIDTEVDGDGFEVITDVKEGTEVKVVAVGVGTRRFPVKIIVADASGREFYQNVAISRTNCGMRDDEFDISNMVFHTFRGAFELPADNMAASDAYKRYIGREVYTLYTTAMEDLGGKTKQVPRLTAFRIKDVRAQYESTYVRMTLTDISTGMNYIKQVKFVSDDVTGDIAGTHEGLFSNLFAYGNPLSMDGVRKNNMADIQKGIVRIGFTENEVILALGERSGDGSDAGPNYTWVYKHPNKPYACVFFSKKTKKVVSIQR